MSGLYTPQHRALQDEFDTRRMADLMEGGIVHDTLAPHERAFIEKLDCFFLATTDVAGRPTVSYKGGDPGFVQVLDERTLLFPAYDGNGMFFSMGNLAAKPEVGFLFIDFETPVPSWKRIDLVQDALPAKDQGKAAGLGGTITMEDYAAKIASGDA